ncbi:hypothetical protein HNQ80_002887 [Anaerosolibacter carboniphilus]|uniref:Phosphatidylglycerol lysyltransferase C-terminal domain-containing protein n=1 Tax=Anaerosolibacter carboniphilus TaxID=1417629 RepID=A0A841KTS2_9FIRM|nr:phosphatidylglycerol lysyltransferase domain-containing protein [Anaerosolibacter carboniphilus]MBB6216783.1 hypothetical protein [Anaerosolibacter carboniphilus]
MLTHSISITDKAFLDTYLRSSSYEVSDLNFTNLFMWRHLYHLKYEVIHGLLWISGIYYDKPFLFPPLFKNAEDLANLPACLEILKGKFDHIKSPAMIKFLPASAVELFQNTAPQQLRFQRDRDNDDYIYLAQDLMELKGRKLHSKKNHLNFFRKHMEFEYVPLTKDLIDDCLSLAQRLKVGNYTDLELDLLQNEALAIEEALQHMDQLHIAGGAIWVDNQVEAFTFGEKLTEDTMLVHIEKANADIRGLYQAINQQFCIHHCEDVIYVNREEDMGFDYLRKAKESYNPVKMLEKYDAFLI